MSEEIERIDDNKNVPIRYKDVDNSFVRLMYERMNDAKSPEEIARIYKEVNTARDLSITCDLKVVELNRNKFELIFDKIRKFSFLGIGSVLLISSFFIYPLISPLLGTFFFGLGLSVFGINIYSSKIFPSKSP